MRCGVIKMYKQVKSPAGIILDYVIRETGGWIPFDPDNRDYQEYLKWLEAGNTPLPADE